MAAALSPPETSHAPRTAQVFHRVFQVHVRVEKLFRRAAMAHGAGGLGQDLHQTPVGAVARPGPVGAFADNLRVDEVARDIVMVGPFVDEGAQFGRLVGVERWLAAGNGGRRGDGGSGRGDAGRRGGLRRGVAGAGGEAGKEEKTSLHGGIIAVSAGKKSA